MHLYFINAYYGFKAHTCFNRLEINPQKLVEGIFEGNLQDNQINDDLKERIKEKIEKCLKDSIKNMDTKSLDAF